MKKFAALYLTPLIAIALVLIKIPGVECFVKGLNGNGVLYVSFVLVIGTIFNHYITVFSPFKKYEKLAKNRWFMLEREGKIVVDKYKAQNMDLRINVMSTKKTFITHIEPFKNNPEKRKITFFRKVFYVVWSYGNYTVNKELKITTNQGVSGKAYRSADLVRGAEFVSGADYNFNFSAKQSELTKDLKIVASFRIFEDGNTPEKKSDKVVGVLNFESETPGSEQLIIDLQKQKDFYDDIAALSNVCSKLL